MATTNTHIGRVLEIVAATLVRAGGDVSEETLSEYQRTYETLDGEEWKSPTAVGLEYRYADSLYQMGLLEQRLTPIVRGSTVCGTMIYFRACPAEVWFENATQAA